MPTETAVKCSCCGSLEATVTVPVLERDYEERTEGIFDVELCADCLDKADDGTAIFPKAGNFYRAGACEWFLA